MLRSISRSLCAVAPLVFACTSTPSGNEVGSGIGQGMAGGGTTSAGGATAGAASTGAAAGSTSTGMGGTTVGAAGTGPRAGSGGAAGSSGASAGGGMGPTASAGSSNGGMPTGGSGPSAGTGGSSAGAAGQPSTAGSGSGGASSGGGTMASDGCGSATSGDTNISNAIVSFPDAYDGSTPLPMIFGFHGAGRTNQQFRDVDASTGGTQLEDEYIMVYLASSGNDWTGQAQANAGRLDTAYDEMVSRNCVDLNHVFAIGHSSGAQFIMQRLCDGEDRFAGVVPVAASKYCDSFDPLPVLYIQGQNDAERGGGNGQDVVDVIVSSNGCGSSAAYDQTACNSQSGGSVDPGCVEYSDCAERTIWCSHDDPHYSGTNHGWPCFANGAIFDFLQAVP